MKGHGFDIQVIIDLYKFIKKDNVKILRTHQYHANLYGRIAGILAGVPAIIPTFHNLYVSPYKPKLHRRIFNYILSHFTDTLIGCSNTVSADILKFDRVKKEKVRTIYNGIVIEEYNLNISKREARCIFGLPSGLTLIGTVGRLTEQKGQRFLIEAVSQIDNVCLIIVGEGPLKEVLKKIANNYKSNCVFLGCIMPDKIPLFLHSLDIFCFPSLWEGLPLALIEALATGLPIVASDIPPIREVIGEAGLLVKPGNVEQLTEALKNLLTNPSLKNELNLKAKKRSYIFSIENTVRSYEDLFKDILRKKGFL